MAQSENGCFLIERSGVRNPVEACTPIPTLRNFNFNFKLNSCESLSAISLANDEGKSRLETQKVHKECEVLNSYGGLCTKPSPYKKGHVLRIVIDDDNVPIQ